jgi:spindle assembly abnormal protein 6
VAPRALVVRVLTGTRMALGQREKLLHIEITDDSDLLFLYTLDVSEDEFPRLKHDQSLLVEFSSFPPSFIELLQQCSTTDPVFTAVLDTTATSTGSSASSAAELRIVEKNQFKNLTHLALRFRAGTDASTKAYLASRVAQFTEILRETSTDLCETRNILASCKKEGAEMKNNLDALRARAASDLDHMRSKFESEHTRQEADYNQRVAEIQQQHAEDVRDANARVEKSTRELRARAEKLEAERADHLERRARLEASMLQLEGSHKGAADEIAGLREEVNTVREENRKLDAANFRNEKTLSQSEEKLKAYAQEIRDKTELLEQMSLRIEEAAEQRTHLEDTLALLRDNQERLHTKFQDSVGEINKGNAIIQRMQAENKQLRSKLKLKSKVLRRQEELVAEKDHALGTAHRERLAQDSKITRALDRAELAESKLERADTKLAESKQLLESNGQVIKWLNQEINQMQLTGRRSLGPSAAALGLAEVEQSSYNRFRPKQLEPRQDSISGSVKTSGPLVDPSGTTGGPSIYVNKSKLDERAPLTAMVKTLAAPTTTSNFASANMFGEDVPLPLQSVP